MTNFLRIIKSSVYGTFVSELIYKLAERDFYRTTFRPSGCKPSIEVEHREISGIYVAFHPLPEGKGLDGGSVK
jgi:hypothetical protein